MLPERQAVSSSMAVVEASTARNDGLLYVSRSRVSVVTMPRLQSQNSDERMTARFDGITDSDGVVEVFGLGGLEGEEGVMEEEKEGEREEREGKRERERERERERAQRNGVKLSPRVIAGEHKIKQRRERKRCGMEYFLTVTSNKRHVTIKEIRRIENTATAMQDKKALTCQTKTSMAGEPSTA